MYTANYKHRPIRQYQVSDFVLDSDLLPINHISRMKFEPGLASTPSKLKP